MTPATPTAAAPIRQRLPSSSSSSARSGNPRPSARLRLPARPRAASMSAEARAAPSPVPPPAHPTYDLSAVIALALSEDAGDRGDVSCLATIPTDVKAEATFIAKEDGVIAGISLAEMIFNQVDPSLKVEWFEADGNYVHKGLQFGKVYGCAQSIIVAERVVLNFMQRMSGIATMTKAMADAARPACILETRKTAPGLRLVDKWAVLIGGGKNHRLGLFDMVMIKDNHISVAGGITNAMTSVDQFLEKENLAVPVEVETRTLEEVRDLLKYTDENKTSLTRIMLDNMVVPLPNGDLDVSMLKVAVQLINGRFETESPPPLCMYYRWIDTHMPAWAVTEIRERSRRAWASLHAEERREKAAAEEKAEQEKELKEYYAEQRSFFDEMLKKNREEARRLEEAQRQRQEAREAERQRKKERARAAKEAEEAADGKGKYPRWTR